jgi:thiol:disulfide interchange protein/DsbC/DsbD-like thiol-disulfide interchange protein
MNLLRFLGLFIFSTAALLSAPESHVQASLVAADTSLQPGHPFTVALRLVHEPHWHTYWKNPGTGLATSLKWQLPEGFKAGDIQWPAPSMLKDREGTVIGSGYEGETFLLVTITPPASVATDAVELKAKADWLMCSDVCVPGGAPVSLTLPVSAAAAQTNPDWSNKLKAATAALPRALTEGSLTARQEGSIIILTVRANQATRGLHFFEEDNVIAFDQPQTEKPVAGGVELRLPVSAEGPKDPSRLRGVLTSESGWGGDPLVRGISVDIPLSRSSAGTTQSASQASPGGATASGSASLGATLLLAFVGGLILNLMPCVFPVLGIKILGFVNQAGHARSKVIAHGLIFASGVLLSFWTLAGVLAILRAGGSQLGWGFQLQSPAFVFVLAALMLVFALNMSGVFEFGLRATSVGGELQTKTGYAGSFFTGVLATVVATPCSAPFLAPALGAALALSTLESFAIFTAIAVGLALPYLLLSIFPGAVKILPRPGAWMETFKQFMAFPLYATVGYLIWVLAGQVADEGLQNILFGLVLIALGVWSYGRWNAPGASVGRVRFGVAALIVAGGCGVWLGWPQGIRAQGTTEHPGVKDVVWEPWSPEAVEKLRTAGRVVYVDFTARWCATCQANKKLVFHSDDVLKALAEKNVATLRADWTNNDPRITAELAKYHRSAVPFNVIWAPHQADPILLPELLTPGVVLDALRRVDSR